MRNNSLLPGWQWSALPKASFHETEVSALEMSGNDDERALVESIEI